MRLRLLLAVAFTGTTLLAGYTARESWIPVAGHTAGPRPFFTTVYMTNPATTMNDVTVSFFASAQPHVAPRTIALELGPNQSGAVDLGPQLVGEEGAVGALRIRSTAPLLAEARVFSANAMGTVLHAIPAQFAIGTAESTILHVPAGARYKLYAVETHGFPLYFAVKLMPDNLERRLYLSPNEQRSWDLGELFRGITPSALQITGVNGSGKIIVAGTAIAPQSQDVTAFEMSLPTEARHRLRWPELTAYIAVVLAIIAALFRMRQLTTDNRQP